MTASRSFGVFGMTAVSGEFAGRRDQINGRIQERHGIANEEAARQLKEFSAETATGTARTGNHQRSGSRPFAKPCFTWR
jgi:hypothetical protein